VAADLLRHYLPDNLAARLDLTALELSKGSFVDEDLKSHFSDLLYKVRIDGGSDAYIYVLFEHKSTQDDWVAFQLLRYMVKIWEQVRKENAKLRKLPPILPLVLYHGQSKWQVSRSFGSLISLSGVDELRPYQPDFEYHLLDLSAYSEDEIKGSAAARVVLLLLKYAYSPELFERLPDMLGLLPFPEESAIEYLRRTLYYVTGIRGGLTENEFREVLAKAFTEKGEGAMETFLDEYIRQGEQRGRQQGLQQGMQQGELELLLRLARGRFGAIDAETEDRIRALPVEQIEELGVAMFDFQTSDDLVAWVNQRSR
jgi:predicted transposase YdaD